MSTSPLSLRIGAVNTEKVKPYVVQSVIIDNQGGMIAVGQVEQVSALTSENGQSAFIVTLLSGRTRSFTFPEPEQAEKAWKNIQQELMAYAKRRR